MSFFVPIVNAIIMAVGLLLLVTGVVVAPWQIKVIILVLGLVLAQQALRAIQTEDNSSLITDVSSAMADSPESHRSSKGKKSENQSVSDNRPDVAHLTYRGRSYDKSSSPSLLLTGKATSGKYRGKPWHSILTFSTTNSETIGTDQAD